MTPSSECFVAPGVLQKGKEHLFNFSSSNFKALFETRGCVRKLNSVEAGAPVRSWMRADDLSALPCAFGISGPLQFFSRWTGGLWWFHWNGLAQSRRSPSHVVRGLTQLTLFDKDDVVCERKGR